MATTERAGFQHASFTQMTRDNELLQQPPLGTAYGSFTSPNSPARRLYSWPPSEDSAAPATDAYGRTALHLFARDGDTSSLRDLTAKSSFSDLNTRDSAGNTPLLLTLAKCWKNWDKYSECAQILIKARADLNVVNAEGHSAFYLTLRGDQLTLMEDLIQAGLSKEEIGTKGNTPLHLVLYLQRTRFIELFITQNNLITANDKGNTVFHAAAEAGEVVALKNSLRKRFRYNLLDRNNEGMTALHKALQFSGLISAQALIAMEPRLSKIPDDQGTLPLHIAIEVEKFNRFIPELTTPETKTVPNNKGETPFLLALRYNVTRWIGFVSTKGLQGVPDNNGNYPLHRAAEQGNIKWIRALATNETINAQNVEGNTPLHFANSRGHHLAALLLIRLGGNFTSKNKKGQTPGNLAHLNREEQIKKMKAPFSATQSTSLVGDCPF